MCGRYLFDPRTGELSDYYQELVTIAKEQNKKIAVDEVFPSNQVVTLIADDTQQIVPILTHWGFTGFKKGQLLINARAETVEEKRTFKKPFLENAVPFQCLAFMSGIAISTSFSLTPRSPSTLLVSIGTILLPAVRKMNPLF